MKNHARSNSAERMGKLMANNQDQTKLEFSAHPDKWSNHYLPFCSLHSTICSLQMSNTMVN